MGSMAERRAYLDHNATTPVDRRVGDAMARILADAYGNPSSVHTEGRRARAAVETARRQVGALIAAPAECIVFTSGGTEADWLGIAGLADLAQQRGLPRVVALAGIEHPAVHGAAAVLFERGWRVHQLEVDANGVIDVAGAREAFAAGVGVVAIGVANHEVGTLQPMAQLVAAAREHGVLVHADAVQAAGKRAVDAIALDVDCLALSAHKLYGPKGTGALYVRAGLDLPPLFSGGHQERERRPGTENVPGIVGMGVAAELAVAEALDVAPLRERLETGLLKLAGVTINAAGAARVPNTTSVHIDGAAGDTVVAALDLEGFAVSTGAACTSGTTEPSQVLLAMGADERTAKQCVRISLGRGNSAEQIDRLLEVLPGIVERARRFE